MSAVWTGTQMIIWGGRDASGTLLNTGGVYTPTSNTWRRTSTSANVPSARDQHKAVWTGTQMIVWGGSGNTGGRYDPATDTWQPTSTGVNTPQARTEHTALWTGTQMIVWGGHPASGFDDTSSGGRYDPSTDTWTPTSDVGTSSPSARSSHTAVWTGAEMIVWGGANDTSAFSSGGRYYPALDSWLPTSTGANCPAGRFAHTAVWTGAEMLVWGGSVAGGGKVNSGGRYDPATDSWRDTSRGGSVPTPRVNHTAVWTGRNMIVWGGFDSSVTNTGARYDPMTDEWTPTSTDANAPEPS